MGIAVTPREKTGRTSQMLLKRIPIDMPPNEVKRLRDMAIAGVRDEVWGTPLGLLFLEGVITAEQLQAGRRYGILARDYQQAIGASRLQPKGASIGTRGGHQEIDPDSQAGEDEAREHQASMRAFEEAKDLLLYYSSRVALMVRSVCEHDRPTTGPQELFQLKLGLTVLASHFGLTDRPKQANSNNRT